MAKYLILAGKNVSKSQIKLAYGIEAEFVNDPSIEDDIAYMIDHEQPMLGLIPVECRRRASRIS